MRILLVDDDADFRRMLQTLLTRHGHEIEEMSSAFGIVNRVAGGRAGHTTWVPDLVILDNMLPGLSGASSLELLARDPRTQGVPVLLLSNSEEETLVAAAKSHPRATPMQKGARLAAIIEKIHDIIERS